MQAPAEEEPTEMSDGLQDPEPKKKSASASKQTESDDKFQGFQSSNSIHRGLVLGSA